MSFTIIALATPARHMWCTLRHPFERGSHFVDPYMHHLIVGITQVRCFHSLPTSTAKPVRDAVFNIAIHRLVLLCMPVQSSSHGLTGHHHNIIHVPHTAVSHPFAPACTLHCCRLLHIAPCLHNGRASLCQRIRTPKTS